jgi:hypothetical protein
MESLTVTPNHAKRVFTIRTSRGYKYRTNKMSKKEFDDHLHNTESDWQNYLNVSLDYYRAK